MFLDRTERHGKPSGHHDAYNAFEAAAVRFRDLWRATKVHTYVRGSRQPCQQGWPSRRAKPERASTATLN